MSDVVEIDAQTGTVTVRDATPDELAQRETDAAAALIVSAAAEAEAAARAEARADAIARFKSLGFTDSEISALVLPADAQP